MAYSIKKAIGISALTLACVSMLQGCDTGNRYETDIWNDMLFVQTDRWTGAMRICRPNLRGRSANTSVENTELVCGEWQAVAD